MITESKKFERIKVPVKKFKTCKEIKLANIKTKSNKKPYKTFNKI